MQALQKGQYHTASVLNTTTALIAAYRTLVIHVHKELILNVFHSLRAM